MKDIVCVVFSCYYNHMQQSTIHISPHKILQMGIIFVMLMEGLDKFFNVLTNWSLFVAPLILRFIPFSSENFFHILGGLEILAALMVYVIPKYGGFFVFCMMVGIACNLILLGQFINVAILDIGFGVCALAMSLFYFKK